MAREKPVTSRGVAARMLKFMLLFTNGLERVGSQNIEGDLRVLASLEDDLLWGEFLFAQMIEEIDISKQRRSWDQAYQVRIYRTRRDMTVGEVRKAIGLLRNSSPLSVPGERENSYHLLRSLIGPYNLKVLLLGTRGERDDFPFVMNDPRNIIGWLRPDELVKKGTKVAVRFHST